MTLSPMQLSEIDLVKIRRFAESRVPPRARQQVRLDVDVHSQAVTIIERRAPWSPTIGPDWTSVPIAQLRFNRMTRLWQLDWRDADLHWHPVTTGSVPQRTSTRYWPRSMPTRRPTSGVDALRSRGGTRLSPLDAGGVGERTGPTDYNAIVLLRSHAQLRAVVQGAARFRRRARPVPRQRVKP